MPTQAQKAISRCIIWTGKKNSAIYSQSKTNFLADIGTIWRQVSARRTVAKEKCSRATWTKGRSPTADYWSPMKDNVHILASIIRSQNDQQTTSCTNLSIIKTMNSAWKLAPTWFQSEALSSMRCSVLENSLRRNPHSITVGEKAIILCNCFGIQTQ